MDAALTKIIAAIREPERNVPGITSAATPGTSGATVSATHPKSGNRMVFAIGLAAVSVAAAALLVNKYWQSKYPTPEQAVVPAASGPGGAKTVDTSVSEKSIAVLPFADMSEKKDQEYFSDGLTDELIDHLAKVPELRVPGRTSSFYFKGRSEDIATIAQKLHVANVLEGSVRLSGHAIRVSAHLIKAGTGYDIWSQTYDRDLNDIFQVQDEIAGKVSQEMKVALNSGQSNARPGESNIAAYNLLLQGDFYSKRVNKEDMARGIEYYKQAIRLDPDYAKAWANLAVAYAWQGGFAWVPLAEAIAHWRDAAERAVKIDPTLSAAHRILGFGQMMFDYDWAGAQRELERARDLDPAGDGVSRDLAELTQNLGHLDESIRLFHESLERNPLDATAMSWLSGALYYAGRLEESAETSREVLQVNPAYSGEHAGLGLVYLRQGRKEDALAEIEREPDAAWKLYGEALVFWALSRRTESDSALRTLVDQYADGSPYCIASIYADRGENDLAFKWLERAYRQHDSQLIQLKVDPDLRNNLHGDPRYHDMLAKIHLAD
jgi:TolB-like protein/Tfp pilus assembly protein PilF